MFLRGMINKRVYKILSEISNSALVIISLIFIGAIIRILKSLIVPNDDFALDCVLFIDNCCLIVLMMRFFLIYFIESVGEISKALKKEFPEILQR